MHALLGCAWLVVHRKTINQCCTGFVQAHYLHLRAVAAKFEHRLVQGAQGGDVLEMGTAHVNTDFARRLLKVKRGQE